jgi:hypothetical protein
MSGNATSMSITDLVIVHGNIDAKYRFMKLGLRGVSVIFASGDSGVGASDGCLGNSSTIFNPDWPARYFFPSYYSFRQWQIR